MRLIGLFLTLFLLVPGQSWSQSGASDPIRDLLQKLETPSSLEPKIECDREIRPSSFSDLEGENRGVSSISYEYALEVFNQLKNSGLPFEYPQDGCFSRAHHMAMQLDQLGITSAKAWLEGDLMIQTPHSVIGRVSWSWHVAPAIKVLKNGREEMMVFDPSIFDRPVTVQEWTAIQTKHPGAAVDESYLTNRFTFGRPTRGYSSSQTSYAPEHNILMNQSLDDQREILRAREANRRGP